MWDKLQHAILVRLREHDQIGWSQASIDGPSAPRPRRARKQAQPHEPSKLGAKRHVVADARGIPLVVLVSGANRHGFTMFEKGIDALPAVRGLRDRPRRWPSKLPPSSVHAS